MTAAKKPEELLHETVVEGLERLLLPPATWWVMPIGHIKLSAAQAAKLHRMGVRPGFPDLFVAHDEKVRGIELKVGKGRPSRARLVQSRGGRLRLVEGQVEVHERLGRAGIPVVICRSLDDVLACLMLWGFPTRAAQHFGASVAPSRWKSAVSYVE